SAPPPPRRARAPGAGPPPLTVRMDPTAGPGRGLTPRRVSGQTVARRAVACGQRRRIPGVAMEALTDDVTPAQAFSLADRVAVLTGAASGIGKATALVFAGAGATVVLGDIN